MGISTSGGHECSDFLLREEGLRQGIWGKIPADGQKMCFLLADFFPFWKKSF
ncbi:hypothetical protein Q670_09050 [Alcanivorax sp. P2S70]|uniref:hypothetical protein n=1 Tax=Alcanivorax profundi TaxID=2338368 RepID=UPI0003B5FF99|nr:hypothetical protein Q670_09050 [Alcanivorax sp. P2S70]|tara:strand:- start:645 stop:800 length:156 start_codon:yes stop_codon:yes gene_type:complete